ncbi:MAG: 6-phosphogluconolactonase [Rhodospirillales bacterium]|nr:6-phosphogluconolactonase [Rhodospirillales bacterium]
MTERKLIVLADAEAVARHTADFILQAATEKQDRFAICLSGGSTPKRLYQILAEPPYLTSLPWSQIHWFWGDERLVPHSDALSNYRMVWEAMLSHAPAPAANIHGMATEGVTAEQSSLAYEAELKAFYGAEALDPAKPLFDINLLGIGTDGHTASLFPGTSVLEERSRWVAPVIGAKAEDRITLTYPALESSRHVAFLVAGADKQAILPRFMAGDATCPSARVSPPGGVLVFADKAATGAV